MSELKLSEEYLNRMRDLLGEEEFSAYLKSFDEERLYGQYGKDLAGSISGTGPLGFKADSLDS